MKMLTNCRGILPAVAGLLALGATATAWAAGCIQGPDGTAKPVVFAKGKQACESIQGYTGCIVVKGGGSCNILDPADDRVLTTVKSTIETDGSMTWSSSGPAQVFAAGQNGAPGGNACVFFHPDGEGTDQFLLGFNTAADGEDVVYANVQEAFFCTDLGEEIVTTDTDVQLCSTTDIDPQDTTCNISTLGTIVDVWTPTYDENNKVNGTIQKGCVCDKDENGNTVQVNIYPCNLSGVNDGDPSTLENCFDPAKGDVQAPITLEYFPDAKRCKTSGGTRTCDCVDNPFTACNECTDVCS